MSGTNTKDYASSRWWQSGQFLDTCFSLICRVYFWHLHAVTLPGTSFGGKNISRTKKEASKQDEESIRCTVKNPKQASHIPYIKLEAQNKINGVTRLDWERLYNGNEEEYFHALTIASDGSLIRARISSPSDSRKLYIQRVVNPKEYSAFDNWTFTNQYNTVVVAAASFGATVSVFWIKSDRKIQ